MFRTLKPNLIRFKPCFNPLKGLWTNSKGCGSIFCAVRSPYGTQEKREAEALREKEQEALGQRSSSTSGVQGVFQERESFCEGNF